MMNVQTDLPEAIYSDLDGDKDLGELVELYVQEMPQRAAKLQSLGDAQQWDELQRLAHQLKGSAGSYGFGSLTALAGELEAMLKRQAPEAEILAQLTKLIDACGRLRYGKPDRAASHGV